MENEIALEANIPTEQNAEQPSECNELQSEELQDVKQEIKIPIKYNKRNIELSVEQASELAQKGMKFDDMRSVMDKLSYLSASTGKSTQKLIDDLFEQKENELSERMREMAGDDEQLFERLLELEHSKHEKAYKRVLDGQEQAVKDEINAQNERIATEFIELNKVFPEIDNVNAIPSSTFEIAKENNISLLDAHLRYRHYENLKIERARREQENAADSSAGSQISSAISQDKVEDALLKGIWSNN